MFINWKIVITGIIVLLILAVFLARSPTVSNFFSSVTERLGDVFNFETQTSRPIEFSLMLDRYETLSLDKRGVINITVVPDREIKMSLDKGEIKTNNELNIINYRGIGSIDSKIVLDGSFGKLETSEASLSSGSIKLNASYSSIKIENLAVKSLSMNSSGILNIRGTETKFVGTISVTEPKGTFTFANKTLSVVGFAKKISIPSSGINIG